MAVRILVVEDEAPIREMYRAKLTLEGFEVSTAADGREGLKAAKKNPPDLLLLDIRMPVLSGDEMLAKLRAAEWGSPIKVMMLTNLSRDEAPSTLRYLNVDRYVVKAHHTPAQVVDIVREVLHLPKDYKKS
ncbi:MAG: hypothetical protein QG629_574 [Patescibacteria group bacterium]|nr:hypothetical protein [Patescibacteria group bacterium]